MKETSKTDIVIYKYDYLSADVTIKYWIVNYFRKHFTLEWIKESHSWEIRKCPMQAPANMYKFLSHWSMFFLIVEQNK